jgi:polysaccharide biosynthesis/export protein
MLFFVSFIQMVYNQIRKLITERVFRITLPGRLFFPCLLVWMTLLYCSSCKTPQNAIYFQNLPKDTTLHNLVTKDFELKIRKGDVINIGVTSLSDLASALFMAPEVSTGGAAGAGAGYQVDKDGNILYPKLGVLHIEGMTRDELKNRLLKDLLPYLQEPIVTVNFVNHKVTVFGEVVNPGVLSMTNEQLTILEALVLSGNFNKTARRDNVLVIRQNGGDKQFKRLNLDNSSILNSPFYYLRPDDIIYVEPQPEKKGTNPQQVISYVTAGLSFIFIVLDRIIK